MKQRASTRWRTHVIRIGLLGCGNVGAAFVQLVEAQQAEVARRTGLCIEITRVAVRNMSAQREVELADGVLTRDAHGVVADPASTSSSRRSAASSPPGN